MSLKGFSLSGATKSIIERALIIGIILKKIIHISSISLSRREMENVADTIKLIMICFRRWDLKKHFVIRCRSYGFVSEKKTTNSFMTFRGSRTSKTCESAKKKKIACRVTHPRVSLARLSLRRKIDDNSRPRISSNTLARFAQVFRPQDWKKIKKIKETKND